MLLRPDQVTIGFAVFGNFRNLEAEQTFSTRMGYPEVK